MTQNLTKIKQELIAEARAKHGTIYPCGVKKSLDECFVTYDLNDETILMFNFNYEKAGTKDWTGATQRVLT